MGIILDINGLKDKLGGFSVLLAIAESQIGSCNPAKVNGQVTSRSNNAPVVVTGNENLAGTDTITCKLEAVLGDLIVQENDLVLSETMSQR